MKAKPIEPLEENVANLCDLGLGNGFLEVAPKARATITKTKNR